MRTEYILHLPATINIVAIALDQGLKDHCRIMKTNWLKDRKSPGCQGVKKKLSYEPEIVSELEVINKYLEKW